MRADRIAITCLSVGLLAACQAPAEQAETQAGAETLVVADAAAEAQAIRAVNAQWLAAVENKDATATASFYTSDGRLMAPNSPTAQGTAAIAEAFAGMFGLPNVAISWSQSSVEVGLGGTLAYDIGTYTLSYDGPTGPVQDHGKYVVVWKKVNDEWRVAADIFNSDLPAQ
jgi:uncharacterized protein (TIGR02246 family)